MSVLLAVLSALLQAIGALFDVLVKGATGIAASGRGGFDVLDPSSLAAPARSTPFLLSLPAYLVGLVLVQLAFAVGRASAVAALVAIGATVLPIGFGLLALGEEAGPARLVGIALVLAGSTLPLRRARAADGLPV